MKQNIERPAGHSSNNIVSGGACRVVLIVYEHSHAANRHLAKGWWSGIFEDTNEGYNYGSKDQLKREAEKDGYKWKVIRLHKKGKRSTVECSQHHR